MSAPAVPANDDPELQGAYHQFLDALSAAYLPRAAMTGPMGLGGPGALKMFFKQNASMSTGKDVNVAPGPNSREGVVEHFTSGIAKNKEDFPTLAKVLISTQEYKATVDPSGGHAKVVGTHVVHFKSTGFSRAMQGVRGSFKDAGHFFGGLFSGKSKDQGDAAGAGDAGGDTHHEQDKALSDAAAADPDFDLKMETHAFCYAFERGGAYDQEWKLSHIHVDCGGCEGCTECAL
jgi:hypothetical protein